MADAQIQQVKNELEFVEDVFRKLLKILPSFDITNEKILPYGLKPHTRSVSWLVEQVITQQTKFNAKQLGLTDFVYPGALHTRFHHALGAMHLMGVVLENLKNKGTEISPEEYEASQIAILLHDIGHGPFSHTLEETLIDGVKHESLSFLFMKELNIIFNGALNLAIKIFVYF